MSIDDTNTSVEPMDVDLDTFSAEFFGQNKVDDTLEQASSDVEEETPDDSDAPQENDTHVDEDDDTLAPDEDEEEDVEEVDETPKPKKNRFQERIDELTSKAREAERRNAELLERLNALEQNKKTEPEPIKAVANTNTTGPTPDQLNEDGTEKYPLGEFDPNYIKDLTLHTLREEREKEQQAQLAKQQEEVDKQVKLELAADWQEKLAPAKERYPDFQEKGELLFETFEQIDQKYGEYLATTLMSLEYGPDVLYYLSNNLDEADKIVKSGPTKAVIALGRIEAKFADVAAEKQLSKPRVSKAPVPPGHLNKGTSSVKPAVKGDEDDLDSFAREFFKKKG
jgi:hypothetical protein